MCSPAELYEASPSLASGSIAWGTSEAHDACVTLSHHARNSTMRDPAYSLLDANVEWFLVLAHPGHELRAYHFLERVRPSVAVMTDGSGADGTSRVDDSRALLERVGGRPSPVFGFMSDREAYAALMAADPRPFLPLLTTIADVLVRARVRVVVIDAAEGYNPARKSSSSSWISCPLLMGAAKAFGSCWTTRHFGGSSKQSPATTR